MLSDQILTFYQSLKITAEIPKNVKVLNPFQNPDTMQAVTDFYQKFYADQNERIMLMGINPGRFGAGITGIPFTDPIRLEEACGIPNNFQKKPELSSGFIYEMIDTYGGVRNFYNNFFVSAVSPLGFTLDSKNLNYYDLPVLQQALLPFITNTIEQQLEMGMNRKVCFSLGMGKNYKFLKDMNSKKHYFKQIIPLGHPRWIMQYRLRKKKEFIQEYVDKLRKYTKQS
ncbi:MAG TPA: uracil-DNA glycosylase family protein [Bacteroidales bacterium]|nr:uracil-DNA glycosylase family protein [Bacteroidales bacterium]